MAPDAIHSIDALKDLDRPDWDSYGAAPVSPNALNYAKAFVSSVWWTLGRRINPVAGPRPGGGVSLMWRGKADVTVEVCFEPIQPTPAFFIVSQAGRLMDKGTITDLDLFVKTTLEPLTLGK